MAYAFSMRVAAALAVLICSTAAPLMASAQNPATYPSFSYDVARSHEIKPHRSSIPLQDVQFGFNQLALKLIISPGGEVTDAKPTGNDNVLKFWPQIQNEVDQWKFTPFEQNGKPVTAEVEEYVDLLPPERLPTTHVPPPALNPSSDISITLSRSGCLGTCPSYSVTITTKGITFDGTSYVVALGTHKDIVDPDAVRTLAKRIIAADFYSMNSSYRASVTDCPSYQLMISIDGHSKQVFDYMGTMIGMPQVIPDLEDAVDTLANTARWLKGADGLVPALQAEHFNFRTYDAQIILKAASAGGEDATVQQLIAAGVPLTPLPPPKPKNPYTVVPYGAVGWLNAASGHPDVLQVLINARASADDQADKNLALIGAANSGNVVSARALVTYGANPNADLTKLIVTQSSGGMQSQGQGSGSVLISAAASGNPEMVSEILKYHPNLEARDRKGRTAIFAAGQYRYGDIEGARLECVRLLAQAGANVNARDNDGNTPLHETFLTDVEEELLKLGGNVNARNHDGETPVFTTYDQDALPLFLKYGADLTIRNNSGQTALQAAEHKSPDWQAALRAAMQQQTPH